MGGSAVRLARQIPYTEAADILLTGKHISADEAKSLGLVGHVVPDGQALTRAREIAAVIAANGPLAVEAILKTLHETPGMTEEEAFAHEQGLRAGGVPVRGCQGGSVGLRREAPARVQTFLGPAGARDLDRLDLDRAATAAGRRRLRRAWSP